MLLSGLNVGVCYLLLPFPSFAMTPNTVTTGVSSTPAPREAWIDWIRAVGSVGIVALHVVTREKVKRASGIPAFDWWALTTYETAARIAVPLFFMVSGYLCLRRCAKSEGPSYAWRRGANILGIVTFWTVIFSFWVMIRAGNTSPWRFLVEAIQGAPYFHLWFLWALAGIFFVSPLLAPGLSRLSTRQKLVCGCLLPMLVSLDYAIHCQSGQRFFFRSSVVSMGLPFLAYTCSGYLLGVGVKQGWSRCWLAIYVFGFVGCLWGYSFLMNQDMPITERVAFADKWVFHPFAFPVCMMSIASFLLISNSQIIATKKMPPIVARLARDSMGIYILHPFVLDTANWFDLLGRRPNALVGVMFVTIVVTMGAWAATVVIMKIPLLRKTISL